MPLGEVLVKLIVCRVCARHSHIPSMEMCAWCTYGWTEDQNYEREASDRHLWYWEPFQGIWRVVTC